MAESAYEQPWDCEWNQDRIDFIPGVCAFSVRANSLTLCKHFVTQLWQFSDGHCLKCWVNMVAVIFLVTLPLQQLLYRLAAAPHKCHNTDKYNNKWHLDQECACCCQGSLGSPTSRKHLINYIRDIDTVVPNVGTAEWHTATFDPWSWSAASPDHTSAGSSHQSVSQSVNKSLTDEVGREGAFSPCSATLAPSAINAAHFISPSWLLWLSPVCHILQNLPQQCIHTIYDLIRGHNE